MYTRQSSRGDGRSGTSQRADEIAQQLKALAWLLDSSIRLPGGFRIGLDALIGLVPLVGDAAGVLLSGYIISRAARLGVPRTVLAHMVLNVAIEGLVGLVPLVGDVFDAAWKANQRNVALLERHRHDPAATARGSRRLVAGLLLLVVVAMALVSTLSSLFVVWAWRTVQG